MSNAQSSAMAAVRRRAVRDLLVITGVVLITLVVGMGLDLFDLYHDFLHDYSDFQLLEIWVAVSVGCLGFGLFALRRWSDLEEAYRRMERGQERLLVNDKMASVGRLTAGIAHEMHTPLGAGRAALYQLKALSDEYLSSIDDPGVEPKDHREIAREMQTAVDVATRGVERAVNFVSCLRHQTRTRGQEPARAFDPKEVVHESVQLLRHRFKAGRCDLRFEDGTEIPRLFGSPDQLTQVLLNLLSNAVDASAPGGGPVDVALRSSNGHVLLEVRDEGVGIEAAILPKIFEPFFTTKDVHQGTGLGLALSHDIVTRSFGGTIDVESTPGLGTTFRVKLPVDHQERQDHGTHS